MAENDNPTAMLARSAKLKLFVMLRRTEKPAKIPELLAAHLRWMIERERAGVVFLSGPVAPRQGAVALDGMTLLRTDTIEQAEDIAQQDPFVLNGAVSFEMREWTAFEGAIRLELTLSDSTVVLR
jgi:uncharacterized protein YciI